jgi:Glyoxalase/Bleomycin resistance protein/Dioxygenase superfamily
MTRFNFGQPVNGYCQLAFVVEDIRTAMDSFTRTVGAGPWFLMEDIQIKNVEYRGRITQIDASLANGNAGHLQIELIQQNGTTPSVFTEVIATRGYGVHHQGIAVRDFDAELRRFQNMGYEVVVYAKNDIPVRAAYLDTHGQLPTFLEIMEVNETVEALFSAMYHASVGWDGSDPVRRISRFRDVLSVSAIAPVENSCK